jgi:hypothetical protein
MTMNRRTAKANRPLTGRAQPGDQKPASRTARVIERTVVVLAD